MLTALLLLSLSASPSPPAPIDPPALTMPSPDWAFVPLPAWQGPTTGVASLMYAVDIDPIEPVQSEELDADIYEGETP